MTLSTGDGAYAAPVCYEFPAGSFTLGQPVGDFYGTGNLDLVIGNDLGDAYLYRNSGNGTLALSSTVTQPDGCAVELAAGVNHDGHIDLVCEVSRNTGGGTL